MTANKELRFALPPAVRFPSHVKRTSAKYDHTSATKGAKHAVSASRVVGRQTKAMKIHLQISTRLHTRTDVSHRQSAFTVCFCSFALILSSAFCLADTCPSNTQASIPPNKEQLDHAYQPPDGDILHRYRFPPPNAGPNNQYPTVLMLPPDVFKAEYGDHGVPSERWATHDLQWTGFLVFQVDSATGAVPGWDNNARLHIKAVVSLSGVTNLDDWNDPGGISQDQLTRFEMDLDNYVDLPQNPPDHTHAVLLAASPWNLVTTGAATSICYYERPGALRAS
jgi:hypothetical protein